VIGEITALLTAVCWSFNSVVFTVAGKRVGSVIVNHIRIWMAFIAMCIIHLVLYGTVFPFEIADLGLLYLIASGLIGLVAGDALLFESYLVIGPRLAMLVMLLTPVFSAFLGLAFLGEKLLPIEITGMAITIGGIAWVISERTAPRDAAEKPRNYLWGILLGVGGAGGQAAGLLLSRLGMEGGVSAISASHVRIAAAALVMAAAAAVRGKIKPYCTQTVRKKVLLPLISGTLAGPVVGIIFSLVAIAHTHIGVASTLMSISPVLLIPVSYFMFKEKITVQTIVGTIIALGGVVILFFT
jgi:drug/metabolite transporter (DMT)-like permease